MATEATWKEGLLGLASDGVFCTMSTILEEMFYVFDGDAQFHDKSRIDRLIRMRLALTVLSDSDYARLMSTTAATPMAVPTAKLSKLLNHDYLTTDVQPLILPPLKPDFSDGEVMHHCRYLQAFSSAMANGMAAYVQLQTAILHMWAIGLLRQQRAASGELEWSISKKAWRDGMFEKLLKSCGLAVPRNKRRGKHDIVDISMRLPQLIRRLYEPQPGVQGLILRNSSSARRKG